MDGFLEHTRTGVMIITMVVLLVVWVVCVMGHFFEGSLVKGIAVLLIPVAPAGMGWVVGAFGD